MRKNKRGFTLVELLAVVVILGIIVAIAAPRVTGVVKTQKENAFSAHMQMILRSVQLKVVNDPSATVPNTFTLLFAWGVGASSAEIGTSGVTAVGFAADYKNFSAPATITGAGRFATCTYTSATHAVTCTS